MQIILKISQIILLFLISAYRVEGQDNTVMPKDLPVTQVTPTVTPTAIIYTYHHPSTYAPCLKHSSGNLYHPSPLTVYMYDMASASFTDSERKSGSEAKGLSVVKLPDTKINGAWFWDSKTAAIFIPNQNWEENAEYKVLYDDIILPPNGKLSIKQENFKVQPACYYRTFYSVNSPGVSFDDKPENASIWFYNEVGPIALGDVKPELITITPPVSGAFKWDSRQNLAFYPEGHWQPGKKYSVVIKPEAFEADNIPAIRNFTFTTAAFLPNLNGATFTYNPEDPKNTKQATFSFNFSRRVDKSDLERRLHVKLISKNQTKEISFKSDYDKESRSVVFNSEELTLLESAQTVQLTIDDGFSMAGASITGTGGSWKVGIPSIKDYFKIQGINLGQVSNTLNNNIEQIITVESTAPVLDSVILNALSVYELPFNNPDIDNEAEPKVPYVWSEADAPQNYLEAAKKITISAVQNEDKLFKVHSYKFIGTPGRSIYATLDNKKVSSVDGFSLYDPATLVAQVGELPKQVKILAKGSLLSASGEKKLSVLVRDIPKLKISSARLLPKTIQHLITQTLGDISDVDFKSTNFGVNDLAEKFSEVRSFSGLPGQALYTTIDFASLVGQKNDASKNDSSKKNDSKYGIFILTLSEDGKKAEPEKNCWGPESWQCEEINSDNNEEGEDSYDYSPKQDSDKRLVILTDLGLIFKKSLKGESTIFVSSIKDGTPQNGIVVKVIGRNGEDLISVKTDTTGKAVIPSLEGFSDEKEPVAIVANKGSDITFLPYNRQERIVNTSKFDVGGILNETSIQSFMFTDRGIYRPGEEIKIASILKSNDWKGDLQGLPLEFVITDSRGIDIRKEIISPDLMGFLEISHQSSEDSPVGKYSASVYIKKDEKTKNFLGSTNFRVEEFLPDTMRITSTLLEGKTFGWVKPDMLVGKVNVTNLYGTPAAKRKITGSYQLTPSAATFKEYEGFVFADPYKASISYNNQIHENETTSEGLSTISFVKDALPLGSYYFTGIVNAFEAESGRSVSSSINTLVSNMDYMLGYKSKNNLQFLTPNENTSVELVAVDQNLKPYESSYDFELLEIKTVSFLGRDPNGAYIYKSEDQETVIGKGDVTLPKGVTTLPIQTAKSGRFSLRLLKDGVELNRINYQVVGEIRDMPQEIDSTMTLKKKDFTPGENIEFNMISPYKGYGLITLERDSVYAHKWFKTENSSFSQSITIPENFEGTGYVSVSFVRALDSKEIYLSPLSTVISPIQVKKNERVAKIDLKVPEFIRPGEEIKISVKSATPMEVVVFGVDEGILQVARYQKPDPLGFFYRKHALEVSTLQMLDLLLPEYSIMQAISGAGGDEDALKKHLNPFKRKGKAPAVFWSGIVQLTPSGKEFKYTVPSYFNGSMKFFVVAANNNSVGVADAVLTSRAPIVVDATLPVVVAPGDEFEATYLITNDTEKTGDFKIELSSTSEFEITGDKLQTVNIEKGRELAMHFRVKSNDKLGAGKIAATVTGNANSATSTEEVSLRPISTLVTKLQDKTLSEGQTFNPQILNLYNYKKSEKLLLSTVPFGLASSLIEQSYIYPYQCSEQISSQLWSYVVASMMPGSTSRTEKQIQNDLTRAFSILRSRQNSDGAIGLWSARDYVSESLQPQIGLILLLAKENGVKVPGDLYQGVIKYLRQYTQDYNISTENVAAKALAIYVLTRSKVITTNDLYSLTGQNIVINEPEINDLVNLLYAASFKMLRLEPEAAEFFGKVSKEVSYSKNYYICFGLFTCSRFAQFGFIQYLKKVHFNEDNVNSIKKLIASADNTYFSTYERTFYLMALAATKDSAGLASEVLVDGHPVDFKGLGYLQINLEKPLQSVKLQKGSMLFVDLLSSGYVGKSGLTPYKNGIEIYKEYQDQSGKKIDKLTLTDSAVTVIRIKNTSDRILSNIALVDLLPGGLEVSMSPKRFDTENATSLEKFGFGLSTSSFVPDYAEAREDRVILFGNISSKATLEFRYNVKPTAKGAFVVPPVYAESMYDAGIGALGEIARIEIQ